MGRLDILEQLLARAVINNRMSNFGKGLLGYVFRPITQDGVPPNVFKVREGKNAFLQVSIMVEPEHPFYGQLDVPQDFRFAYEAITKREATTQVGLEVLSMLAFAYAKQP